MSDWINIPKVRNLTFQTRSCEWNDHVWERFEYQYDYEDRSERHAIAVLCLTCGRDPLEAMAALPIVVTEAEYPELKKVR